MNRSLLVAAILLIFPLMLVNPLQGQQSSASIAIKPAKIDLGKVGHGEKRLLEFSVVNQTKSEVEINRIRPTCGCMKILPHDIRTPLGPAESRSFQFELSLGRGWGSFKKKIEISLSGQASVYLPVEAQFHPGFRSSALEVVLATALSVKIPESKGKIEIINLNGTDPPHISELRTSNPKFQATVAANLKDRSVIEVVASSDFPPGRFNGKIEGKCNGLPFIIPLRGRAFQHVIHDPQSWNLNQVKKSGFAEKTLKLRRADGKPLRVLSCRAELTRFPISLDLSLTSRALDDGTVEIQAYIADPFPLQSGGIYGKVTMVLDSPDQKEIVVDLLGVVRAEGANR